MNSSSKSLPIMIILNGLCSRFQKHYCFPSQEKIMSLLNERLSVRVAIATLNRHLLAAVEAGYIKRTRRIKHDPVRGMVFNSTLYQFTKKGYQLLKYSGVKIADKIARFFSSMFKKPSGSEHPSSDPVPDQASVNGEENQAFLQELISTL